MSSSEVSRFVTRGLDDERVREQLQSDPSAAFEGYDLSNEEEAAIAAADEEKLRHLGLDPMTARSWAAFHDVGGIAPDRPDLPGDVPGT